MQTIGSLDSMVRSLRDELALLREKDAEHNAERKRLMALIEAKDRDHHHLAEQMAHLLGKVDSLTKALEDKSNQLPTGTEINSGQRPTETASSSAQWPTVMTLIINL